jgi:hypothetical protein
MSLNQRRFGPPNHLQPFEMRRIMGWLSPIRWGGAANAYGSVFARPLKGMVLVTD